MRHESTVPREMLEASFPPELIKSRPGAFGTSLSYLEGHTVIQRLNDAFQGAWSFEVTNHQILQDEVLVLGKLNADPAGIVKMAFGSSKITRNEQTGEPVSIGDDLKAAATDALKKAATLLGVGLSLYGSGNGRSRSTARLQTAAGNGNGNSDHRHPGSHDQGSEASSNNGQGRVTNKQISAIFGVARSKNIPNAHVRDLARQMFNRQVDYLTRAEASSLIEHLLAL